MLLVLSDRTEDLRQAEFMAFANDLPVIQVKDLRTLPALLAQHGKSGSLAVFWDADDPVRGELIGAALANRVPSVRIFAVTDDPLHVYPHLSRFPVFGHHFLRRYDPPAPTLYARLLGAALSTDYFGLPRFFPEGVSINRITVTMAGQKRAAVEAIENIFMKQKVNSRLAALVAQAVDELVMNAIFDAPVLPNGMYLRRGTARDADFELIDQEHVRIEVASSPDYVGICVADQFGSLKKGVLMGFLNRDYQGSDYQVPTEDYGAGLGLRGLVQSGLSVLFACKPEIRTEVMVFFRKDATYKDFRGGFRFLSVFSP
jgi:hypothetical protein